MTDTLTVAIPNRQWNQVGYSMLKEINRLFPDEQYTFSQVKYGTGKPILIKFTTADAATMMRLIWSGYERD